MSRLGIFLESGKGRIIAAVAIATMILIVSAGDLTRNISPDLGFYFANGWFISQGMLPYEDFFTHKTPLFPVAIAGWMMVFGTSFFSAWLLKLSTVGVLTGVVYFSARKMDVTRSTAMIAAALTAFFSASHTIELKDNGLIVVFASSFELVSIASAYAISRKRGHRKYGLIAGASLMLGIAARQTALFLLPFIVVALILVAYKNNRRLVILGTAWIFAGLLSTGILLLLIYIAAGGGLSSVTQQLIEFNTTRVSSLRQPVPDFLHDWFVFLIAPGRLILTLGIVTAAGLAIRKQVTGIGPGGLTFLSMASLGIGLSLYALGGFHEYYFRQIVPLASLLTAVVLAGVLSNMGALRTVPMVRTFVVVTLIWVGLLGPGLREFEAQVFLIREYSDRSEGVGIGGDEAAIASFLRDRHPNDELKLLVVGAASDDVYAYARAKPVSIYTNSIAMLSLRFFTDEEIDEWVEQVRGSDYDVILAHSPRSDAGDDSPQGKRYRSMVERVTQGLNRIEYPNAQIGLFER